MVNTPEKFGAYGVEKALDEWIAERDQDGLQ